MLNEKAILIQKNSRIKFIIGLINTCKSAGIYQTLFTP